MATQTFDIDSEFFKEGGKLVGWGPVEDHSTIEVGQHLRITKNRYQASGRVCSYVVVQKIIEASDKNERQIWINSFGEAKYKDWLLDLDNPFKQIRVYKRLEKLQHTGYCIRGCGSPVKEPYYLCYHCRMARK